MSYLFHHLLLHMYKSTASRGKQTSHKPANEESSTSTSYTRNLILAHNRKILPTFQFMPKSFGMTTFTKKIFPAYLSGTIFQPLNLGGPHHSCKHCGALFWYDERLRRERHTPDPTYNLCCKGGKVYLQPYDPPSQPLLDLLTSQDRTLSSHFFKHISSTIRCLQ